MIEILILTAIALAAFVLTSYRAARREGHSLRYHVYMNSWLWQARRWFWYWFSDRRCERCGRKLVLHARGVRHALGTPVATFHHRTYEHLGFERRSEIERLCWPCHCTRDAWRYR